MQSFYKKERFEGRGQSHQRLHNQPFMHFHLTFLQSSSMETAEVRNGLETKLTLLEVALYPCVKS